MKFSLEAIRDGATVPDILRNLPKIPVASAVSGLIVAAVILVTPNSWFEAFVVESGLPTLISAAEPPLGARARIMFALVAALLVTLMAWGALSATVGRKMRQKLEARRIAENEKFDPDVRARALRRGDAHPDAPYRRPIMAADDLGTALDDVDVEPVMEEAPENVDEDDLEIDGVQPDVEVDAEADLEALDLGAVAEVLTDEAEADAEMEVESEPVEAEITIEPIKMDNEQIVDDAASDPVFEVPLPRRDEARPLPSPTPTVAQPSINTDLADLVARFEAGLERKRRQRVSAQDIPENVATHPQARPVDDQDAALKDALDALQQVSGEAS